HKGIQAIENNQLEWGIKIQKENIQDKISEWKQLDSAFYNLPHPLDNIGGVPNPNQEIILNELKKTEILLSSYRNMGYLQWTKNINNLTINTGTRGSYWTYNEEFLLSPRISISYAPFWKSDVVFRSSTGIYYQSPFYKELRTAEGIILNNIQSQKSIHYILASDYLFYKWGRPFKLTTEFYYKQLNNIIPYKVENVYIQYLPDQIANGYATGIDVKINGEFVKNTESWMSFSLMKTEENIKEDYYEDNTEVDYIPRPTDQRFKLNIFFQDYIPQKENYKMHLNLVYGSGLPFGPPKGERYQDILRIPSYRRVDIGFSVNLKSKQLSKAKWLNVFDKIWFSAEVFNLLDINNTVSYIWISDITGRQYAVPNYMTSRQLNGKLILNF
ncbi:MAG: TonB-dependent receptor, partial [Flavobacteriales bacterium]|nr:TonB-dependent receptor [Flavobacteriales bacterium]